MRKIKIFCDRCKRELATSEGHDIKIEIENLMPIDGDYCGDCAPFIADKIRELLKC